VAPRALLHFIDSVDPPSYSCPMGLGIFFLSTASIRPAIFFLSTASIRPAIFFFIDSVDPPSTLSMDPPSYSCPMGLGIFFILSGFLNFVLICFLIKKINLYF
jgi:hypothetical protein